MRSLRIIIAIAAFSSLYASADQIYQVNILSGFTATQPCVSNCTEIVTASFQYDWHPDLNTSPSEWANIVPGTLWVNGAGLLGSVTGSCCYVPDGYYISLLDAGNDEIDLNFSPSGAYMDLWSCRSSSCQASFNPLPYQYVGGFMFDQTFGWSEVTLVPEPSALLLLLPIAGIAWWRRQGLFRR